MTWLVCVLFTLLTVEVSAEEKDPRPNIVFMLADDLGWSDIQKRDPNVVTPQLSKMAEKGRELHYHYALSTCTPSRAALLTGIYPYKYGFQQNVIKWFDKVWLNESLKLLPQYLKDVGYDTHMIGKWHLGYCDWSVTPLGRGFDTFYGFVKGNQGYFNHSRSANYSYDFRDQKEVVWSAKGKFATRLHTDRALDIINGKNKTHNPFFMYMSYQSVHNPWEVPAYFENKTDCVKEPNITRRLHCGMVAALDASVGKIRRAVNKMDKRQNKTTLVIFISDNGGPVDGGSSNYPLRGKKATLFEGGTRSYAIIYGRGLLKRPYNTQYKGLFHITDWLPTLMEVANGTVPEGLDGVPLWDEIRDNKITNRSRVSFIYNVKSHQSAARYNNFKLTKGNPGSKYSGWYAPSSMWNSTVSWETPDPKTVKKEMMFDIDKDPAERIDLLSILDTLPNDTYKEELLFAKQQMTAMLDKGKKEMVSPIKGEASTTGQQLAQEEGAVTPGDSGWCYEP